MSNIEIIDLIKYANENQPVNFASALDNILSQKTLEVLAAKREEVAANMFKDPEDEDEDEEYDDEDDYDDDGIDVEELETDEDIELEDDGETDD